MVHPSGQVDPEPDIRPGRAARRGSRLISMVGVLVVATLTVTGIAFSQDANAATQICEKYGSATVGSYIVQNNNWGDDTQQCISVTDNGFSISTSSHNKPTNGAPGSYPSIYAGCHYAACSPNTNMPVAVSSAAFAAAVTGVSMSYPGSGQWDAAYDIWFDPTARKDGQNTGAELMVWLNHAGAPQPVGSKVATVTLAGGTWDVWEGNIGWNVVSYVRTSATGSISFRPKTFFDDMVARGFAQNSWYMTSVQAGFEPWVGGTGLAVNSFSYALNGGPTSPPPTTPVPTTPVPTGNGCSATFSVANSWQGGFVGQATVKANAAIKGWRISWPLSSGQSLASAWGGKASVSGSTVTITNESWNGSLAAGATTYAGFQINGSTPSPLPVVSCTSA